jgi:TRIAD3 protein (E3 ubiquitin-protein ligase RNF216)
LTCNEKDHPNISCQEVAKEKARLANPTHRAHEAMTKAVTRLCPTCSKEYVKHDGCNKMTCTCKTKSCYLCGVKVDSYDHFCRHKKIGQLACHCGKTCELFTSTERMEAWDRKARYKAGKKVLKETGMDKKEIRRFLKRPEKKKAPPKKKKPHPVAQQQQQVPGSPPPPAAQPANAVPWEPLPGANVPDPLQVPIVLEPQVPGPPPPPAAQPENAVPQQPLPGANIPDPPLPIVPEQQVPDPPRPPRAAAANAVPQQPLPWEPLPGAKVDPDGCPIL